MNIKAKLLKEPDITIRIVRKKAYWRRDYKRIPSKILDRWLKEKLIEEISRKLNDKTLEELYNMREAL